MNVFPIYKKLISPILILLSFILVCSGPDKPAESSSSPKFHYDQEIHWHPLIGKKLHLAHVTLNESYKNIFEKFNWINIAINESFGEVQSYPPKFSENHDETIRQAKDLYAERRYEEAAALLLMAIKDEPENLFIINDLARTLFWIGESRQVSFTLYKKLIGMLDADRENERDIVVVDLWFFEAHWKLGCLYLDSKEYEKAVFELTRGMCGMSMFKNDPQFFPAYEQVLSYLCEAYYFLRNYPFARYFAYQTLHSNP
ncbi:MAG: tetratricopeptide repeat protein, partial [Candidatus Tectomicrobia bacterium]|nr:tetratricopeptide repeat protein [Candidatus Tectomicrobia bacterium]